MAKKIIWSRQATIALFEILEYWDDRNKSKVYSSKLFRQLQSDAKSILNFPLKGKKIEGRNVRFVVSGVYLLIYRINKENIEIVELWDGRRNPEDLDLRLF